MVMELTTRLPVSPLEAGQRLKVLVVDNEPDCAVVLALLLEEMGCETRSLQDPRKALLLLHDYKPDLALVDIAMPYVTGFDIAREVRRDRNLDGTRMVAISGYCRPQDIAMASEAGFDDHVSKPVGVGELSRVLSLV